MYSGVFPFVIIVAIHGLNTLCGVHGTLYELGCIYAFLIIESSVDPSNRPCNASTLILFCYWSLNSTLYSLGWLRRTS